MPKLPRNMVKIGRSYYFRRIEHGRTTWGRITRKL
jgi:hypothetical protein